MFLAGDKEESTCLYIIKNINMVLCKRKNIKQNILQNGRPEDEHLNQLPC